PIVLTAHRHSPIFFFFSSRRRHTRSTRDWSSDVCSSDLLAWRVPAAHAAALARPRRTAAAALRLPGRPSGDSTLVRVPAVRARRSEERRVGKEWRSWMLAYA